jgi:hypothetical protein
MIVVLLPKGGGDYRGIGLLDPIWKVVEKVMVARLSVIKLHDCLHGGLPGRGTGTAIMEVKLQQQLAWVDQAPLYQIYLDLRKAYDALDRGRCLEILAGYGIGPNLLRLQKKFWDDAKMVCCAGGNYGLPFGAHRGVTQGGPLSSLMFNVCVDCVVREWLRQVLGEDVARDGVGDLVRDQCIAFFVDDGLVAARCPEWLQSSFDILINLFERIGLRTNAEKTKVMTCLPGKIRVAQKVEEYASQQTGLGTAATKRRRVACEVCGASLAAESLRSHLETQHDIFRSFALNRDIVVARTPEVYRATESPATSLYFCPVAQCGGQSGTRFNLRRHFLMRHPQDLVCIPIEGSQPLPQCKRCGLQTPVEDLNGGHHRTELCQRGWERKRQHAAAVRSQEALERSFTAYGEELERVEVFKYLGWLIAYDDADTQAMRSNLRKARGCWARVSRVLRAENATARTCGMFYKATVQAILLFGSETWSLSPTSVKRLEGFHIRAAWRMSGMRPERKANGSWSYPHSKDVLEATGLQTIAHYMDVCRQTVANFIVNRPIWELCAGTVRKRGSPIRPFWWDQPMDLDLAKERGMLLAQGPAGPAIVEDENED